MSRTFVWTTKTNFTMRCKDELYYKLQNSEPLILEQHVRTRRERNMSLASRKMPRIRVSLGWILCKLSYYKYLIIFSQVFGVANVKIQRLLIPVLLAIFLRLAFDTRSINSQTWRHKLTFSLFALTFSRINSFRSKCCFNFILCYKRTI